MSVVVSCKCGKKFKAKDEMAGKKVRCPECKTVIRIPGAAGDTSVSAVTASSGVSQSASKSAGADKGKIDAEAALLKYEAAQKQKQMTAEAEAAYKQEQQKLIASYDQLAGKAAPADLEKKKKKDELLEKGVKSKPTVATKAADAAGSFFSNSFVKYLIIVGILGGATYGSVAIVKYITGYVSEDMGKVTPREERVKKLMDDARAAIDQKDYTKANKFLDEIVRIDPTKEKHRTYLAMRDQVAAGIAGKP
ncbi:MAG: hypothetical protein KF841_16660 [Phycisphaerae bacterium]|nr:hypothetical protein [Phycisphaerae bacterium]